MPSAMSNDDRFVADARFGLKRQKKAARDVKAHPSQDQNKDETDVLPVVDDRFAELPSLLEIPKRKC